MEGREVELIAGREKAEAAKAARRRACSSLSFGRLLAIMVMASVRVMYQLYERWRCLQVLVERGISDGAMLPISFGRLLAVACRREGAVGCSSCAMCMR